MDKFTRNKEIYEKSWIYRMKLNLVAGGLTGIFTDVICYPLETIKTRSQIHSKFRIKSNLLNSYRGFSTQLVMTFPVTTLYFMIYESTKYFFDNMTPAGYSVSLSTKTFIGAFLGELISGFAANPFEIVKQKIQVGQFRKIKDVISNIKRNKGVMGFFKGYLSLIAREIPFSCFQFPIYEVV
jgi:solute carrier family 25 S-adenosylmethionine transporter 26